MINFETWWETANTRLTDLPEDQARFIWNAARDKQAAQAEPVADDGLIYAWIYVDQYGLDSKSASKEWCEEMIRLHGGSMFPLYPRPPRTAQQDPVAYRVTVDFMGKTREFFTDLYSVAESLKKHRDGFIQPLYAHPAPAVAQGEPGATQRIKVRDNCEQCGGFGCNFCMELVPTPPALAIAHPPAEVVRELVGALKAMMTHAGMDEDEWTKPTFDQARAAMKAAKEHGL